METGEYRNPSFIPADLSFENSIKRIKGKDKELFIDFIKKMLCWLPEERWTAKQLLSHPWLKERTEDEMRSDYEKVDDVTEHMAVLSCAQTRSSAPTESSPTSPVDGSTATEETQTEPSRPPTIRRAVTNELSSSVIDSILYRKN